MWDYEEDLILYTIRAKRIGDDDCKCQRRFDSHQVAEGASLGRKEASSSLGFDAQPDDPPPDSEASNKTFWKLTGKKT
jgi:hypothetical protein